MAVGRQDDDPISSIVQSGRQISVPCVADFPRCATDVACAAETVKSYMVTFSQVSVLNAHNKVFSNVGHVT